MSKPLTPELMAAARIKPVASLTKLINTPLDENTSVLLYRRELPPELDFDGLARELRQHWEDERTAHSRNKTADFNRKKLRKARKRSSFKDEIDFILQDMDAVSSFFNDAELRVVGAESYTDHIYIFHEDGMMRKGRICACYNWPTTEGIVYEDAMVVARDRYHKKYAPIDENARIFHFEPGDIWKHATSGVSSLVFLHRAPEIEPGAPPRLFLAKNS